MELVHNVFVGCTGFDQPNDFQHFRMACFTAFLMAFHTAFLTAFLMTFLVSNLFFQIANCFHGSFFVVIFQEQFAHLISSDSKVF